MAESKPNTSGANTAPKTSEPEAKLNDEVGDTTLHFPNLQITHGDKADEVFHKVAQAAGFGSLGKDFIGADGKPTYPDLDFSGSSDDVKKKIAEILKAGK